MRAFGTGMLIALALMSATDCVNIPEQTAITAFASNGELKHYLRGIIPHSSEARRPEALLRSEPRAASSGSSPDLNGQSKIDQGDIVELHGDTMVILGSGRLRTALIRAGGMTPVDSVKAFPRAVDSGEALEEEMIVEGDLIVVLGYASTHGGILISRFRSDSAGHLRFADASELELGTDGTPGFSWRSSGRELIIYSQIGLPRSSREPLGVIPSFRRWDLDGPDGELQPIADAREIYVPVFLRNSRGAAINSLHAITRCEIVAAVVGCRATGILGPEAGDFYAGEDAVFIWAEDRLHKTSSRCEGVSLVYRLPFDTLLPSATRAGHPNCPR